MPHGNYESKFSIFLVFMMYVKISNQTLFTVQAAVLSKYALHGCHYFKTLSTVTLLLIMVRASC